MMPVTLPFRALTRRRSSDAGACPSVLICSRCQAEISADDGAVPGVCPRCRLHTALPARRWVSFLADNGSFREVQPTLPLDDPLGFSDRRPYRERLAETRVDTGEREGLVCGSATIGGRPAMLAAFDFAFIGGSFGLGAGERFAAALDEAQRRREPVIVVTATGGVRLQEGMLALLQMARAAAAIRRFQAAGLALIVVLTNPSTGGVLASIAGIADVTLAEPGATIGFAGPRLAQLVLRRPPSAESYSPPFLFEHGLIDRIVDRSELRSVLDHLVELLAPTAEPRRRSVSPASRNLAADLSSALDRATAGEAVTIARAAGRPAASFYVRSILTPFFRLQGDRAGGNDQALLAGLGSVRGQTVMLVGFERREGGARPGPAAYRAATRLFKLAERLSLPVVTIVDTPGADVSEEASAGGLAWAIAECLATLVNLRVPTIAAVTGEGGSGGALALAAADRVLMQANSYFAVLDPEAVAALLWKDPQSWPLASDALRLGAAETVALRVADQVVPEPPEGAGADPHAAAAYLGQAIGAALAEITAIRTDRLLAARLRRYSNVGHRPGRVRIVIGWIEQFYRTHLKPRRIQPAG